jgi:hypothetical protein
MHRILFIACAAGVLIASGVVHGVWTDRWAGQADLVESARRLEQLPMTIGAWHGTSVEMDQNAGVGLAGMVARRYVHAQNGKAVTILLACGRARAVCIHTPEACYGGSGFDVEKPRPFKLTSAPAAVPPEFWTARFVRDRAAGRTNLRIFWSWHGTQGWKVAEHPRIAFAGEKSMLKLYLIREMLQPDEPLEGDACVEFMQELLPAIRRTMEAGERGL